MGQGLNFNKGVIDLENHNDFKLINKYFVENLNCGDDSDLEIAEAWSRILQKHGPCSKANHDYLVGAMRYKFCPHCGIEF